MGRRKQHCPKKANDASDEGGDEGSGQRQDYQNHAGDGSPSFKALDPGLQLQADLLKAWLMEQNMFHSSASKQPEDKAREEMTRLMQLQAAQRLAMQAQMQATHAQFQAQIKLGGCPEEQQHLRRKAAMVAGTSDAGSPLDLSPPLRKPGGLEASPPARMFSPIQFSMMAQQQKLFPGGAMQAAAAQRFPGAPMLPAMHPLMQNNYALSTLHRMSELAQQSLNNNNASPKHSPLSRPFESSTPWQTSSAPSTPPSSASSPSSYSSSRLKDVPPTSEIFACVWCQEKLSSLAELTQHLKEANHGHQQQKPFKAERKSPKAKDAQQHQASSPSSSSSGGQKESPASRKLVRGQDVWLGKGQEQTRQILKCMWCGESFKSLAEMTVHMTETRHYTKVISQEQISSWRSGDQEDADSMAEGGNCKICGRSFPSQKDITAHMASKHDLSSPRRPNKEDSSSPHSPIAAKNEDSSFLSNTVPFSGSKKKSNSSSQPKEKRKKSLPVRKLLELERKQQHGSFGFHDEPEVKRPRMEDGREDSPRPVRSSPDEEEVSSPFIRGSQNSSSSSILGSLEKMVESSFMGKPLSSLNDPVAARRAAGTHATAGLLQRLGIEASDQHSHLHGGSNPLQFFLKSASAAAAGSSSDPLDALKDMCSTGGGGVSPARMSSNYSPAGSIEEQRGGDAAEDDEVEEVAVVGEARAVKRPKRGEPKGVLEERLSPAAATSSESKFLKYSELAKQLSGR